MCFTVRSCKQILPNFLLFRYELLFGVTSADATFALNNRQLEYGLEPEERNRILSDFVSSNYGMHQREIFAAIVNEYTDWQSVAQHPVNIRDNTLEALTDAHYVAPIVETGDYHSSLNARSWFYVFDYQTKNSYYKQVWMYEVTKKYLRSFAKMQYVHAYLRPFLIKKYCTFSMPKWILLRR